MLHRHLTGASARRCDRSGAQGRRSTMTTGTPPTLVEEGKREKKRRRDALRRPDSWERFRILCEVVEEQRNVVEIADHKARYALLILGVLNAVIFVLLGRGGVF